MYEPEDTQKKATHKNIPIIMHLTRPLRFKALLFIITLDGNSGNLIYFTTKLSYRKFLYYCEGTPATEHYYIDPFNRQFLRNIIQSGHYI